MAVESMWKYSLECGLKGLDGVLGRRMGDEGSRTMLSWGKLGARMVGADDESTVSGRWFATSTCVDS